MFLAATARTTRVLIPVLLVVLAAVSPMSAGADQSNDSQSKRGSQERQTADDLPDFGSMSFQVMLVLTYKEMCDAQIDGYAGETAAVYSKWRKLRAATLKDVEKSPQYQTMRTRLHEELARHGSVSAVQEQKDLRAKCYGPLLAEFGRERSAPDPRLATPEKAWARYMDALRKGDRQTAIACLASTAAEKYGEFLHAATSEQLRKMAESIKAFSMTGLNFDNTAEGQAVTTEGHGGLIYFQKEQGEWRISEM